MRRCLLAFLFVFGAVATLAAPAVAVDTVELTIAWADGRFTTRSVPAGDAHATAVALQQRPDVRFASVPVPMSATAVTPNDARYPQQWHHAGVRTNEAWERTTGGDAVVVAVVDSGVDASHPDLAGAVLPGKDFVDDDADARDENGHGTTVAGIVAARAGNSIGGAGACWACRVLPVRVLDENGDGGSDDIAAGVVWAADNGADVINLSLSGDRLDPGLTTAVAYAREMGIVVVAASGNNAVTSLTYPAAIDGVISVGSSDRTDARASFSNYGPWVDVAAPGVDMISTASFGCPGVVHCYVLNAKGTSFSAPLVSGIVALGRSAFPSASPSDLESTLTGTAVPVSGGWVAAGRVDAKAYLDALAQRSTTIVPTQVRGNGRVDTAIALSKRVRTGATSVIIARSDSPADALAAAPLAGKLDAPVLLTSRTALEGAVRGELVRLGASTVWLMGGAAALSPAVEAAVRDAGVSNVRRLDGASRFDTARLVAEEVGGTSVYVADGIGWADAVAVSGLAAFTKRPVLLSAPGSLPAETSAALARLGATEAVVFGGAGVVSDAVLAQLQAAGLRTRRVWGSDRYATSELVANEALAAGAAPASTYLATGADWPDALAAGPAAATQGGVLLLLDGRNLGRSPSVTGWLSAHRSELRELVVVGGETQVTSSTMSSLAAVLVG